MWGQKPPPPPPPAPNPAKQFPTTTSTASTPTQVLTAGSLQAVLSAVGHSPLHQKGSRRSAAGFSAWNPLWACQAGKLVGKGSTSINRRRFFFFDQNKEKPLFPQSHRSETCPLGLGLEHTLLQTKLLAPRVWLPKSDQQRPTNGLCECQKPEGSKTGSHASIYGLTGDILPSKRLCETQICAL